MQHLLCGISVLECLIPIRTNIEKNTKIAYNQIFISTSQLKELGKHDRISKTWSDPRIRK